MSGFDHLVGVARALLRRPMRTLLTLLGIIVGTGSIVLISGLLQSSADQMLRANQDATDADLLPVRPAAPPPAQAARTQRALSRRDGEAVRDARFLHAAGVVTETARPAVARWHLRDKAVTVVGAEPSALALYRLDLRDGRFLVGDDLAARRRVCVVGEEVWRELLESAAPSSGIDLAVGGQTWRVVGVLAHKPTMATVGGDTNVWNRKVIVPATTFDAVFAPAHEASRLFVRVGGTGGLERELAFAQVLVHSLLLRRHLSIENFAVGTRGGAAARQAQLIAVLIRILIVGSGALSLFVGGINVMNIMFVTVSERAREIGLRRALGATQGEVLLSFLLESSILTIVGGLLGVLGAVALSWLIALMMRAALGVWTMHVVGWAVAAGMSLSLVTGVIFGVMPARRAARLDPVHALRQE